MRQSITARHVAELERENEKLRERLAKARDPQRIGGTADPESFVYAIEQLREFRWQHATNDKEAIPDINNVADAHERENAKLRELVRDMMQFFENGDYCDECGVRGKCDATEEYEDDCLMREVFRDRMRELGIEVD